MAFKKADRAEQATPPAPTLDERYDNLKLAIAAASAELSNLRQRYAVAVEGLGAAADPSQAAAAADRLGEQIMQFEKRVQTLNRVLEDVRADMAAQAKADRDIAAHKDREKVMNLIGQRVMRLAPDIDRCFDALVEAVTRYVDSGNAASAFARRAMANAHGTDVIRLHDDLLLRLPRTAGIGADAAIGFAAQIRRVIDALGSDQLSCRAEIDAFLPRSPATVTEAAELDQKTMTAWSNTR